jgi:hypothetical protein
MAEVGFWKLVCEDKERNEGKVLIVGLADGIFQGVVILHPLGSLHPIEDEPALLKGLVLQFPNPFRMNHGDLPWI